MTRPESTWTTRDSEILRAKRPGARADSNTELEGPDDRLSQAIVTALPETRPGLTPTVTQADSGAGDQLERARVSARTQGRLLSKPETRHGHRDGPGLTVKVGPGPRRP